MVLSVDVGGVGSAASFVESIGAAISEAHAAAAPVTTSVAAPAGRE